MKVLFVGDIVGRPGRAAVKALLPRIIERNKIDFVIVNGENASGGFGITGDTAKELFSFGAGVITSGNHIWDKKDILPYISKEDRLLRPLNFPPGVPGFGSIVTHLPGGGTIAVLNLQGRVFMPAIDCPFRTAEAEVKRIRERTPNIIVDFHAEATSEKVALGYYLDGKVSAVIGTHTHVQTADEKVLPGGTAYITDVGMTGPVDSVIGTDTQIVLQKFITGMPVPFEVAKGPAAIRAVLIQADDGSGRATAIRRVTYAEPS